MSDPSARTYMCPTPGCGRQAVVSRPVVEEFISPIGGEKPKFFIVHCAEHGERLVTLKGERITDWNRQESHRKQL